MRSLIITLLIIAVAPSAHAIQRCYDGERIVNTSNGYELKGLTATLICKEEGSEIISRKEVYKNGEMVYMAMYHDNGKIKDEMEYDADHNTHGWAKEYYENGQLKEKEKYIHGQKRGAYESFYPSGKIQSRGFVGEKSPATEVTYNEDGTIADLDCSEDPKISAVPEDRKWCGFSGTVGEITLYNGKGKPTAKAKILKGVVQSVVEFDDAGQDAFSHQIANERQPGIKIEKFKNGKTKQEVRYTKDGCLNGEQKEFAETGQLTRKAWFEKCFMVKEELFYLNGQRKRLTEQSKEGEKTIVNHADYFDSGKLQSEGKYFKTRDQRDFYYGSYWNYNNYEPIGEHRSYYENGQLSNVTIWKDGSRIREKRFSESGALESDDELFPDGSRKAYSKEK